MCYSWNNVLDCNILLLIVFWYFGFECISAITYRIRKYANINVCIIFYVLGHVYETLSKCDFFATFSESHMFPTIHDAVLFAQQDNNN